MKFRAPHCRVVCLFLALLALVPQHAAASGERLYQWQDARTGRTQLSGRPPGWYRAASGVGPRVLVFSAGRLIDDTALAVSDDLRRALREEALLTVDTAPAVAGVDEPAPTDLAGGDDVTAAETLTTLLPEEARDAEGSVPAAGDLDARRQALEVIERFDRARLAAARAVVEALLPLEESVPVETAPGGAPPGDTP
jgi:hypothetical protein